MSGRRKSNTRTNRDAGAPDELAEAPSSYASALQSLVLDWYNHNGRRLPWRETQDPYRIWLSEIMLQQTTVSAVIPYFQRFIERFPTVATLASAPLEEVLRCWEGLGYYSRARNLHRAAGLIVSEHGGDFPRSTSQLNELPGIGRYTAGAIAAFAWDLPAAILEANTERLYARLTCLEESADSTAGRRQLWAFAESIVPRQRAGDFNQALMDIGSRVCTPTDPHCGDCPLSALCLARQRGLQLELPRRRPRPEITELSELAIVLEHHGKILLRQRSPQERWAGLHDFPRMEADSAIRGMVTCGESLQRGSQRRGRSLFSAVTEPPPEELAAAVENLAGIRPLTLLATMQTSYTVTRYRVSLLVIRCQAHENGTAASGYHWFPTQELDDLPMPIAARRIVEWLKK